MIDRPSHDRIHSAGLMLGEESILANTDAARDVQSKPSAASMRSSFQFSAREKVVTMAFPNELFVKCRYVAFASNL